MRELVFPEVSTCDLAEGLYYFTHHCELTKVELVRSPMPEDGRFLMSFRGVNVFLHRAHLHQTRYEGDLEELPVLFEKITEVLGKQEARQ